MGGPGGRGEEDITSTTLASAINNLLQHTGHNAPVLVSNRCSSLHLPQLSVNLLSGTRNQTVKKGGFIRATEFLEVGGPGGKRGRGHHLDHTCKRNQQSSSKGGFIQTHSNPPWLRGCVLELITELVVCSIAMEAPVSNSIVVSTPLMVRLTMIGPDL